MTDNKESKVPAILIVEDDFLLRVHSACLLGNAGFNVVEAENAEQALKRLEAHKVDILFTDIHMPGNFDGLALARAVHNRWPHIKLLITSGQQRSRPEDIPDHGGFISKPFLPHQLLSEINNLVGQLKLEEAGSFRGQGKVNESLLI
jgi:two-component system, response regulator PdtaR